MAVSIGDGHLVRGYLGHLKRDVTTGHLLRRDITRVTYGGVGATDTNRMGNFGIRKEGSQPYTRSDVYPELFTQGGATDWPNSGQFQASSWYRCYNLGKGWAEANSFFSYTTIDTLAAKGIVVNRVKYTVRSDWSEAGMGVVHIGFRASTSRDVGNTYEWVSDCMSVVVPFNRGVAHSESAELPSDFTFSDYLITTVWVNELEPPIENNNDAYLAFSRDSSFWYEPPE